MKVLFVSSGNSKDGISSLVKNQGDSLICKGLIVDYFTIKGHGIIGYTKNIYLLNKISRSNQYDLVHAHYSFSAIVAGLATRKPLIVSLMGSDIQAKVGWNWVNYLFSLFRWKIIIVKSEQMKTRFRWGNKFVIPNGVNLDRFKPLDKAECQKKVGFDPSKKHIIFVSNPVRYEKNFLLADKAVKMLNRTDVILHVIYNIENYKVPLYMNAADVLLLTSFWEGSPNVIKESMACNLPIVSTDVGDVKTLISNIEGCYICDFSLSNICEKLRIALNFGHRTKGRRAIMHLDERLIAEQIIDLYNKVLQNEGK